MATGHPRRDVLKLGALLAGGAALVGVGAPASAADAAADPWDQVPDILARIRPPVFAPHIFDIRAYGAVGDGTTDCTDAFRRAIEACTTSGGGLVVVPTGAWLTGAIHLRSD